MAFNEHPEDALLQAYGQDPEAPQFSEISLHLASCAECRQQLQWSQKLRSIAPQLRNESVSDEQQRLVDEFTYEALDEAEREAAKASIRNNPAMLKSALYSLAQQQDAYPQEREQTSVESSASRYNLWSYIKEWFNVPIPAWAGFATAAVLTITLSAFISYDRGLPQDTSTSFNIASYQDNASIRFIPQQNVPGIGFFSGANDYARPYPNIKLKLDADARLQLQWPAVDKATEYQLSLYRHHDGDKQLVKKVTTSQTSASVQLPLKSFNERFEWVLSGRTSEQQSFITSGGFVISN
jgi:hypothetical protein